MKLPKLLHRESKQESGLLFFTLNLEKVTTYSFYHCEAEKDQYLLSRGINMEGMQSVWYRVAQQCVVAEW